jgi:uncharacterized protein (TIGR02757 family)
VPTSLKARLDGLYESFDHPDAATDPVNLVRPYDSDDDREIVAFCAAGLAFGRVASVLQSISALLEVMGTRPAGFVRSFEPAEHRERFRPLVHRWTRGADLMALLWVLRSLLEEFGTLEAAFIAGDDGASPDIGPALDVFCARALRTDLRPAYGRVPARPGVCYFFPRPSAGSACKRLNLFLRWMVRRDRVDFGVWRRVSPARLVVPLDTHVIRLGRCLGLTRYRSPGWKMAADITASLRAVDPDDPVKYDFSLCHVGMMGSCGYRTKQRDHRCPLRGFCHPSRR